MHVDALRRVDEGLSGLFAATVRQHLPGTIPVLSLSGMSFVLFAEHLVSTVSLVSCAAQDRI